METQTKNQYIDRAGFTNGRHGQPIVPGHHEIRNTDLIKITGINESLLTIKKPRKQQIEHIEKGLHSLSSELSAISLH